jgi:hypothetical protein
VATMLLPNNYTIVAALGSQWSSIFTVYDDDGTLANLTNKTFEFVVRNRLGPPGTVLFSFTSTTPNAYGSMVVSVINSTVQVIVNPTATSLITEGGGPYTLWMDQGLSDATALVTGTFYANPVANP